MSVAAPPTGPSSRVDVAALEQAVRDVPDPEIPVITLGDLGIVREVAVDTASGTVDVTLTPTYSGCPATEVIAGDVARVIAGHGMQPRVVTRLSPAWTTDWMSERGRERLREFGIAPPAPGASAARGRRVEGLSLSVRRVACPRCGSEHTEQIARFGSTPCKALRRCLDCREPFDEFKQL